MKKVLVLLSVICALVYSCSEKPSSVVEKSVKVWGNCEKCKGRIEKTCKVNGVTSAEWNVDSKLLVLKLDTAVVKTNDVLKLLSSAGHDNESFFANDYSYTSLPECCQYERRLE